VAKGLHRAIAEAGNVSGQKKAAPRRPANQKIYYIKK
jgi:hypothetical protein